MTEMAGGFGWSIGWRAGFRAGVVALVVGGLVACVSSTGPSGAQKRAAEEAEEPERGEEGLPDGVSLDSVERVGWSEPTIEVTGAGAPARAGDRVGDRSTIDDEGVRRLFSGMPDLPSGRSQPTFDPAGEVDPPDRAGKQISSTFPPDESDDKPPEAARRDPELRVERIRIRRGEPSEGGRRSRYPGIGSLDGDDESAKHPAGPRTVAIQFNRPMVETGSVDDVNAPEVPVDIEPEPIGGGWSWKGPRLLLFESAEDDLVGGTTYTVTVPEGTESADGARLKVSVTRSFETEPLRIVGVERETYYEEMMGERRRVERPEIRVVFSRPMLEREVGDDGAPFDEPVTLEPALEGRWFWENATTLVFRPGVEALPKARTYELSFPRGLTSAAGGALGASKTWTIETSPPAWTGVAPKRLSERRRPLVFLHFNQTVREEVVREHLAVKWAPADIGSSVYARKSDLRRDVFDRMVSGRENKPRVEFSSNYDWRDVEADSLETLDREKLTDLARGDDANGEWAGLPERMREIVREDPRKSWIAYRLPEELPGGPW